MIISLFALEILKILQNQSCNFCLLHSSPRKGYLKTCGTCDMWLVSVQKCPQVESKSWGKGSNWEAAISTSLAEISSFNRGRQSNALARFVMLLQFRGWGGKLTAAEGISDSEFCMQFCNCAPPHTLLGLKAWFIDTIYASLWFVQHFLWKR